MTAVARAFDELEAAPSVVTIGVFDGVHRGHRTIIRRAAELAESRGCRSVVLTFDRHPEEVVRPDAVPSYLQTLDARIAALAEEAVDLVFVLPFDRELSQLPPDEFVTRTLAGPLEAVAVVIGSNFRFGHRAAGDVATLEEAGGRYGFEVEAVDLVGEGDATVSSTAIRKALRSGDVDWAAWALGRPYALEGEVGRGEGRGRTIGVPTANIAVEPGLEVPAVGVYAGRARVRSEGEPIPCVTNIGSRPTFAGRDVTVEAHLLDTDIDLYGERLTVTFEARLRDEQRFDGPELLVAQIKRDIDRARELL